MQNRLLKLILNLDIPIRTSAVHIMLNILKMDDTDITKLLPFVNACVLQYFNIILISNHSVLYQAWQWLRCTTELYRYDDRSLKLDGAKE